MQITLLEMVSQTYNKFLSVDVIKMLTARIQITSISSTVLVSAPPTCSQFLNCCESNQRLQKKKEPNALQISLPDGQSPRTFLPDVNNQLHGAKELNTRLYEEVLILLKRPTIYFTVLKTLS